MIWFLILLANVCLYQAQQNDAETDLDFLGRAGDVANTILAASFEDLPKNVDDLIPAGLEAILPVRSKSNWDWIETFKFLAGIITTALEDSTSSPFNVSRSCLEDFDYYVQSALLFLGASVQDCKRNQTMDQDCELNKIITQAENYFAFQVLDATGKVEPGFLDGNFHWWGRYDQCLRVSSKTQKGKFQGRYCLAHRPLGISIAGQHADVDLEIGTCFPDTCSSEDIMRLLIYVAVHTSGVVDTGVSYVECRENTDPLNDPQAAAFVIFASIWAGIMVIASAYDYFWIRRPFIAEDDAKKAKLVAANVADQKIWGKMLLSFSLVTNSEKILTLEKGKNTIGCLHGMRFLSMAWVILGHTYVLFLGVVDNVVVLREVFARQFFFQAIGNATLSVDTFFLLSGFLLGFLWLKEAKRTNGESLKSVFGWIMFYVHRFLRLTPVYMIVIFYGVSFVTYTTNGPVWPRGTHDPACTASWYYNLLYVNNFFNLDKQCLGHTWYLANDMQFYWFSPLILVPLYLFPPAGILVGLIGIAIQMVLFGYYSAVNNYAPNMNHVNTHFNDTGFYMGKRTIPFNQLYVKPYMRMGPYIVGILWAFLLHRIGDRPRRLNPIFKYFMRFLTIGLNVLLIYGVFDYVKGKEMPVLMNGFYTGTRRTLWAANLGWIIFECVTGNGGVIDRFLSLSIWLPLSRLTYCAYLLHPLVLYLIAYGQQVPWHYSNELTTIWRFLGNLGFSYLMAFIFSVSFEAPFLALEKLLINGLKAAFAKDRTTFGQAPTAQVSPATTATTGVNSGTTSSDEENGYNASTESAKT